MAENHLAAANRLFKQTEPALFIVEENPPSLFDKLRAGSKPS
jgi:hypothetical protein